MLYDWSCHGFCLLYVWHAEITFASNPDQGSDSQERVCVRMSKNKKKLCHFYLVY